MINSLRKVNFFKNLRYLSNFSNRHIGVSVTQMDNMLKICKVNNIDELVNKINPNFIKYNLPKLEKLNENDAQKQLNNIMNENIDVTCYIGMGYYDNILPYPIKRHILENAKWYTSYTPYQAEISQGRLESQYNFQEIIKELTGLPISNASLLDEASCAGEVINMCYDYYKKKRDIFICSDRLNKQTLDVLKLRAKILNVKLEIIDISSIDMNKFEKNNIFGIMFQYPDTYGEINLNILEDLKKENILLSCSTDLMALTQLKSPGELGIDISFGNAQRLGVPLWFGGPHPAFLSINDKLLRLLPGRIIGKTIDKLENEVYRLALQTREQHIRREKATSNICTSQSLLTNVVSMYVLYHGRKGIIEIGNNIHKNTKYLSQNIRKEHLLNNNFFDKLLIKCDNGNKIYNDLLEKNIILRKIDENTLGISIDESKTINDIDKIIEVYNKYYLKLGINEYYSDKELELDENLLRNDNFLEKDIYNKYSSETELLRYIKDLEKKDYTLCDGMIPLGSCTMKLNGVNQLEPLSWSKVTNFHPYLPKKFVKGYKKLIDETGEMLKKITGFEYISFQSNSGAMGEYSGLLCIKEYHKDKKNVDRNLCLIPNSAHGTNFASAQISNYNIKKFDDKLLDNLGDFEEFVNENKDILACLMITYPNTNGVFQKNIKKICQIIHNYGGLVYMDGANMNALVGLTNPALCGADVCHLNLHKTFCIPHGGGGPGMGPILCNDKLKDYLPTNNIQNCFNEKLINSKSIGSITSSNWSSASLLTIPYMYILTMGSDLKNATEAALLNSNYMKTKLDNYYTIIDVNENGYVGHEFIIDVSEFKKYNITENDIAKRLIDYSFHPPTMSWPRTSVLMFEPTESESKEELDRLIDAMINIRKEINYIIENNIDREDNILKNAPHTIKMLEDWKYEYSIQEAFYPIKNLYNRKFDIPVSRVNDLYGDKLLLSK